MFGKCAKAKCRLCKYLDHFSGPENCVKISELIISFDYFYYCFTIFAQQNGEPNDKYILKEQDSTVIMVSVETNQNKPYHREDLEFGLLINVHDKRKFIYHSITENTIKILSNETFHGYDLGYRKLVVNYLFEPRNKPCHQGKDLDNCINECFIESFTKSKNTYPALLTNGKNISRLFEHYSDNDFYKPRAYCVKLCQLKTECYFEDYYLDKIERRSGNTLGTAKLHES